MAHLIDKSALVAEIERISCENPMDNSWYVDTEELLKFLDTLEVKEPDFEKEFDRIWFDNKFGEYFNSDAVDFARIRTICKHFFELGFKTQK